MQITIKMRVAGRAFSTDQFRMEMLALRVYGFFVHLFVFALAFAPAAAVMLWVLRNDREQRAFLDWKLQKGAIDPDQHRTQKQRFTYSPRALIVCGLLCVAGYMALEWLGLNLFRAIRMYRGS